MSRQYSRSGLALLFSAGMVVFALCAHREALILPRLAGLLIAGLALVVGMAKSSQPRELLGVARLGKYRLISIPLAVSSACALAVFYRCLQHQSPLPEELAWFCIPAAGIGICEEIAYRGFVQGSLRRYGLWVACIGGAVAHAAYKCSMVALPDVAVRTELLWLGAATVFFSIIFGLIREACGSVLFPVLAHATFDVVTYGDLSAAPWWVGM